MPGKKKILIIILLLVICLAAIVFASGKRLPGTVNAENTGEAIPQESAAFSEDTRTGENSANKESGTDDSSAGKESETEDESITASTVSERLEKPDEEASVTAEGIEEGNKEPERDMESPTLDEGNADTQAEDNETAAVSEGAFDSGSGASQEESQVLSTSVEQNEQSIASTPNDISDRDTFSVETIQKSDASNDPQGSVEAEAPEQSAGDKDNIDLEPETERETFIAPEANELPRD